MPTTPQDRVIRIIIRDWQRRRNAGVRNAENARRNATYILKQVAGGGWATEFVRDMVSSEGFAVTDEDVQAVATELLDAQAEQEAQATRERAAEQERIAEYFRYSPDLTFTAQELAAR